MHFADEMLDHFFRHIEIRDHPIAHGANGLNAARRAPQHQFGVLAHGQHRFAPVLDVIGHHRGFVQDNSTPLDIDQRIGGAEIYRHVGCEQA